MQVMPATLVDTERGREDVLGEDPALLPASGDVSAAVSAAARRRKPDCNTMLDLEHSKPSHVSTCCARIAVSGA